MTSARSLLIRSLAVFALALLVLTNGNVRAAAGISSGFDLANLDRTCKPCTDFYQFAVGGWIKNHPIPPEDPSYGAFFALYEKNQDVVHGILDRAATANAHAGSNTQKIGDYYSSCMNQTAIDAGGTAPIAGLLSLAQNATASNLPGTLAQLQASGVDAFFGFGPRPDAKDSTQSIANFSQSGLGLPNRDYYTRTDAKSQALVTQYQMHVAKMLTLLGDSSAQAAAEAQSVVDVETALAKSQATIVQLRDPNYSYNKMSLAKAAALAPALDLAAFVKDNNVAADVPVNVSEPDYMKALNAQVAALPPSALHAYLRWHVVHAYAAALPQAFQDENFNFYSKTLSGVQKQPARWKQCAASTDRHLGDALGEVYVQKTFPPAAKASALAMVKNIKQTFRDDLSTLSWMSPQTRAKAVGKLDAFLLKIGYPERWRSYASLPVTRKSYAQNLIASARFQTADANARIGRKVDRSRWGMTPPTVNAYYNPSINEIVFPAGILQPPFFNAKADMAVNYGGIGAVIGHESTHGFDDEGRKYDAQGNLVNWWTPEDAARFDARAQCVVDQWNQLSPLPGLHENGKQVEGEEIADLGGLTIAYKAFEKWQAHHPRRTIDGFTPEQRFFLGWAQVWANSARPEEIRLLTQGDVHGYDKFRVNQTLSDMPQFASAFFCKLNDAMVRPKPQQCQIW